MQRTIVGFHQDEERNWVADLDCGHGQHMRHNPPFFERPWVVEEETRNARIGEKLACVKCDQFEWPEDLVFFRKTPEFDQEIIPPGLLKDHATKDGVWGRIVILEGTLIYRPVLPDGNEHPVTLTPTRPGIVVPEMKHAVEPDGEVRFFVEFYSLLS